MNPFFVSDRAHNEPQYALTVARYVRMAGQGARVLGGLLLTVALVGLFFGRAGEQLTGLGFAVACLVFGQVLLFISKKLHAQRRLSLGTIAGGLFGLFGTVMVLGGLLMVFDDPAGFALMLFGLVFVGVGYLAWRFMRPPEGMKAISVARHRHTFEGRAGVKGTRTRTVQIYVDEEATEAEMEAARKRWLSERWRKRPDWATGRIEEEEARTGSLAYWAAALWNVFAWGLVLASLRWGEPPLLFVVMPVVVALALTAVALRTYLRQRTFGPSRLMLERSPVFLGERLTGTVETGVQERLGPEAGFAVQLACLDRYEVRDSDDATHLRTKTLWETEQRVNGRPYPSLPRRLAVPIDLVLPADQRATTLDSDREGITWELRVTAAVPGLDYAAVFELPVFHRMDDPSGG